MTQGEEEDKDYCLTTPLVCHDGHPMTAMTG